MRRCLLVLLLSGFACAAPAPSSPSTLIANVPNRTTVSLNGAWRAIVDPFDNGKSAKFFLQSKATEQERARGVQLRCFACVECARATGIRSASR